MYKRITRYLPIVLMSVYLFLTIYHCVFLFSDELLSSIKWKITPIMQGVVMLLYIVAALLKNKSAFCTKVFYWVSAAYFLIQVIGILIFSPFMLQGWLETLLWLICGILFIALAQNCDVMLLQHIALIALLGVSIYQNIYVNFVWSDLSQWSLVTILYVVFVNGLYALPPLLDTFFGKSMKS